MVIDKHIGFNEVDGFGIMGDAFAKELMALDAMQPKCIDMWINSVGGGVLDGMNIYNAMLKSKTPVDTYCVGIAASIAGVIFQGGRKRYMADYSKLMYHNPYGGDDDKSLDALRDSLVQMVCSRTAKAEDEVRKMMNRTTWIAADEALQNGFCDEVQHSGESNKKRASKAADAKALWSVGKEIVNKDIETSYQKNSNIFSMKKVNNRLNLNPEATEEAVVLEIDKIENKVKDQATEIQNNLAAIKAKDDELAKAKTELEDAKNKVAALEAKAKADEEAKTKADEEAKAKAEAEDAAKAKNMVEGYVKDGRIKNDATVIKEWTDNCKVLGIDKVKNMIESLPINRAAAKITVAKQSGAGNATNKLTSVIANKMSQLREKAYKNN